MRQPLTSQYYKLLLRLLALRLESPASLFPLALLPPSRLRIILKIFNLIFMSKNRTDGDNIALRRLPLGSNSLFFLFFLALFLSLRSLPTLNDSKSFRTRSHRLNGRFHQVGFQPQTSVTPKTTNFQSRLQRM